MPIDWAAVDWANVGLLSGFALVASFAGHLLFRGKLLGAIVAAVLFAAILILWFYYLPGHVLQLGSKAG